MDGFGDVRVTGAYPIGIDNIGVEYEVSSTPPVTVNELNDYLFNNIGESGLLGNTDLLLLSLTDSCPTDLCLNGGVCKLLSDLTFVCICDADFGGDQCQETDVNGTGTTGGLSKGAAIGLGLALVIFLLAVILICQCVYNIRLTTQKLEPANLNDGLSLASPIGFAGNGISPAFPSLLNM
ncbi:uncharacterized protein [Amphiura filiformis]|uniref:uncharacterized protein n=1 Tax=Amphiura filiformis TaxID=82378 RepID=UPI003B212F44